GEGAKAGTVKLIAELDPYTEARRRWRRGCRDHVHRCSRGIDDAPRRWVPGRRNPVRTPVLHFHDHLFADAIRAEGAQVLRRELERRVGGPNLVDDQVVAPALLGELDDVGHADRGASRGRGRLGLGLADLVLELFLLAAVV